MQIRKNILKEAAYDLRFLLNRGYRKKNALAFVANKYLLYVNERNYLARSIFSSSKSALRRDKVIDLSLIEGKILLLDGYNVLITVESLCRKDYDSLILCDDGVIRDLNAVFGKYKFNENTERALNGIIHLIKRYRPLKIKFFFDKQVSFSGKLANLTEEIMRFWELNGEAVLSKNVDFEIIKLVNSERGIVATSDSVIIDKVDKIVDLPSHFLNMQKISIKRCF
jgi:hypothetical protein